MQIINYYEIELSTYHDEIVGRIQFANDETHEVERSALYSIPEIMNILSLWRMGELLGSFGIGTKLADNARFQMFTRG